MEIRKVPLQETFDHVVLHCITQGQPALKPSMTPGMFVCTYMDSAGHRCAAGCLMPEHIARSGDGKGLDALLRYTANCTGDRHDFGLVCSLQSCHDGANRWDDHMSWLREFRRKSASLALAYGLDDSVCWFEVQ